MKNRKIFVCFIGLDGSGKSTLINSIIKYFQLKNIHLTSKWGAYDQGILRPFIKLAKKIFIKNINMHQNYDEYYKSITDFSKSSLRAKLFRHLVLIEYHVEIFFKIKLPLMFSQNIILDRYVYDTATNLSVNLNKDFEYHQNLIYKLLKKNPEPDIVFFIDIPEEESMKRKDDIPSIEYLKKRRMFYKNLVNNFDNIIKLNGLDSKEELVDLVIGTISSFYSIR